MFFLHNPDRPLTRDVILNSVWGYESYPNTRTVDIHVVRLRQKLEPDPAVPRHFLTIHGVGYDPCHRKRICAAPCWWWKMPDGVAPLEISLAALEGVRVLVLSSGRDALRLIQSVSLELAAVITDIHLPFVDGFRIDCGNSEAAPLRDFAGAGDQRRHSPRNTGTSTATWSEHFRQTLFTPRPYATHWRTCCMSNRLLLIFFAYSFRV